MVNTSKIYIVSTPDGSESETHGSHHPSHNQDIAATIEANASVKDADRRSRAGESESPRLTSGATAREVNSLKLTDDSRANSDDETGSTDTDRKVVDKRDPNGKTCHAAYKTASSGQLSTIKSTSAREGKTVSKPYIDEVLACSRVPLP